MKITLWNKKGGVGKTNLSYNIARDLKFFLLSNDDSVIEIAYPNKAKITNNFKILDNCVYDLGGFVDVSANTVLKNSDIILIPTFYDLNALRRTQSTISDIQKLQCKATIIIIANNLPNNTYHKELLKIKETFNSFKVLPIPNSKIFSNAMKKKTSILEIGKTKLNAYRYRKVLSDYKNLLKTIIKDK